MKPRYLVSNIKMDLTEKMVFLSGPRQCGKTTLATSLLGGDETHPAYFNWDHPLDREKLMVFEFPANQKLLVFDELHKYKHWRNWLKGLYDKTKSSRQYLVTGSARLDYYKRSGDALTGRFHHLRLHPFSLNELDPTCRVDSLNTLIKFGAFPEPLFRQSKRTFKRWQLERMQQVMQEDLRDLERVQELSLIELLVDRLPNLVGSPLSINGLREDLQTSHQSVAKWILILERLFVVFRIYPYGAPKIRAVKKEAKHYMWDWSMVVDPGARFENMVAC